MVDERYRNKHNVLPLPTWVVERYASDSIFRCHFNYTFRLKLRALQITSGEVVPMCQKCGCDYIWALGVNHKNGGGTAERKANDTLGSKFYRAIVNGERKTDDLEVLCHPCNSADYLYRRYGTVFKIKFVGIEKPEKEG